MVESMFVIAMFGQVIELLLRYYTVPIVCRSLRLKERIVMFDIGEISTRRRCDAFVNILYLLRLDTWDRLHHPRRQKNCLVTVSSLLLEVLVQSYYRYLPFRLMWNHHYMMPPLTWILAGIWTPRPVTHASFSQESSVNTFYPFVLDTPFVGTFIFHYVFRKD